MSREHRARRTSLPDEDIEALARAAATVAKAWGFSEGARRAGITPQALRAAESRPSWTQGRTRLRILAAAPAARAELERASWERSQRSQGRDTGCGSCGRRVRIGQDAPSSECARCGRWLSRWGDVVAERGATARQPARCRCACCCCARVSAEHARRTVARGIAEGLRPKRRSRGGNTA